MMGAAIAALMVAVFIGAVLCARGLSLALISFLVDDGEGDV